MTEPVWLTIHDILAMHEETIRLDGGVAGIRNLGLVESALARPRQRLAYEEDASLAALAASLGYGLCRNHGFADGNKRVAFYALAVFLDLNGFGLDVSEREAVKTILALAGGGLSEDELALWVQENCRSRP